MTDLRTRIANLHMNLPTLKRRSTSDGPKEEIVLFEGASKSSIVDKLSKHRPNVLEESKKPEDDAFKWLRIKEKMVMDMENRRDEEWKKQTASDRLENEELEEEEEAVEEDLFGTGDDAESEAGDAKDDGAAEDENDEEIEEDEADDDIAEDDKEEDEEETDDRRGNAFIDDQAVEDDEDSDEELFVRAKSRKSQTKPKMIIEDDSEEEESDHEVVDADKIAEHHDDDLAEEENETKGSTAENDNQLDTCPFPFPNLDTQESDYLNSASGQFCISQNLLLTPLDEVEEEELREIGSPSRAPADDCLSDTQALANLCSGQFGFDSAAEAEDEVDAGIGFHSDDNMIASEAEEDGEMADDEEEDEEDPAEAATTTTIVRRKNRPQISDFIEDEAELSGSEEDVSSDENDDEDGDEELEEDAVQEDLPSDDEMREQANRKYLKDLEDEDKRRMMILMEQYFEDGDLHDENGDRKKKFKWNMNDEQLMEQFANVLSDSEDENDTQSNDDDSGDEASGKRMVVRLKKEVVTTEASLTTTIEPTTGDEETSAPGTSAKSTTQSIVRTTLKKKMTNTSIRSFFIKDERLKNILSNNKRSANGEGRGAQFNKKQKVVESRSIFDVLGC